MGESHRKGKSLATKSVHEESKGKGDHAMDMGLSSSENLYLRAECLVYFKFLMLVSRCGDLPLMHRRSKP